MDQAHNNIEMALQTGSSENSAKLPDDKEQTEALSLEVPDGGLDAWLVVMACWMYNFSTWGANSGFSIYLAHYISTDTFVEATKLDYGLVGGLTFGAGIIFSSFINYMVGLTNLKLVIGLGCVLQLASTLLASFSTKLWQLYLTQGVMQGFGLACIAISNLNILPQWFRKKRNLAIGITASGSGAGGIIFNLAMQEIINKYSYKWALRAQGILCASMVTTALFFTKSRAKTIKPVVKVYDAGIYRCFGIWLEVLWCMFTMFGYVILLFNLADFTRSLGYNGIESSVVSTMVQVGSLVFRPVFGLWADKSGPVNVGIIVYATCGLFALAMWIPTRNFATAVSFALIEGSLMGTVWIILAPITAEIVGLRKMGIAMAIMWAFTGASGIISPLIGIELKRGGLSDPTQYVPTAIFVGVSFLLASLMLVLLRGWLIARKVEMEGQRNDKCQNDICMITSVSFVSGLKYSLCFHRKLRRV